MRILSRKLHQKKEELSALSAYMHCDIDAIDKRIRDGAVTSSSLQWLLERP
jgi:hypothetical protein